MKKFFTQKINFAYAVIITLVMTAGLSSVAAQYASPGQLGDLSPVIHRGGGDQSIDEFRLGECPPGAPSDAPCQPINGVDFDARGPGGAISWFDDTSSNSSFAVLQNSFLLGKLVIGSTSNGIWQNIQNGSTFIGDSGVFSIPVQKVNVVGNTLATNLQNQSGNARVCATNTGELVLCPEVTYYQYQCDYSIGTGQWGQPTYGAVDGTNIGGGTIQGGVAVFDSCPVNTDYGQLNEYNSSAAYTSGDNVCATSLPSHLNCTASPEPAYVCGGLIPGEWNSTGYGAPTCPYQNYSGSVQYSQGDIVCAAGGVNNANCTQTAVPAFVCQATGEWSPTGYGAPTCPYSNYSGSVQYSNGDIVCAPSGTPTNANCTASTNGQCGLADGGTFSSTPSNGLCSNGIASTVSTNLTGGGGSCSGTPLTSQGPKVDWLGNPFEWTDGVLYQMVSGSVQTVTTCATGPSLPYDLTAGDNIDYNAAPGNAACFAPATPYTWPSLVYEASTSNGNWQQVNLTGGTVNSAPFSAGNTSSPGWINSINNLGGSPLYSSGGGGSCNGTSQTSCTSVAGCNWNSGTSSGGYTWTCAGTNGGSTDSCSANYQPGSTNGQCGNFPGNYTSQPANAGNGCLAGSYQDTSDNSSSWNWQCNGINGGLVAICDADRVSYSWNIGPWGTCSGGTQTRSVTCEDNNGNPVSNSLCGFPSPITSQSCGGGGGGAPGNWFVCGVDGSWKMGPSANSTIVASTSNYSSATACSGATNPVNNDAGAGGQDFFNPQMRCWNAVPSNCSCFTPGYQSPGSENC